MDASDIDEIDAIPVIDILPVSDTRPLLKEDYVSQRNILALTIHNQLTILEGNQFL